MLAVLEDSLNTVRHCTLAYNVRIEAHGSRTTRKRNPTTHTLLSPKRGKSTLGNLPGLNSRRPHRSLFHARRILSRNRAILPASKVIEHLACEGTTCRPQSSWCSRTAPGKCLRKQAVIGKICDAIVSCLERLEVVANRCVSDNKPPS